jgi:hypothetical protein
MNHTVDPASFAPLDDTDPALPGDPFQRPRYSYGQMLGAEDFTAEQRYHLVRARLRNALLHGSGVVCGLEISRGDPQDLPDTQLRCTPGLAIDAQGREILVPETICLDVTGLAANAKFWPDLAPPPGAPAESMTRRCYAVLSYRACLSAEVPAIAAPCSDSAAATAYSRVVDSYKLCLQAAAPPDPDPLARDWTQFKTSGALRSRLQDFITALPKAPARLWTRPEDAKVLLAVIDLTPPTDARGHTRVTAVDTTVRALLPDVQTVAQIAMGIRLAGPAQGSGPASANAAFRALDITAAKAVDGRSMTITITLSHDALPGTVTPQSVRLFVLAAGAWMQPAADPPAAGLAAITVRVPQVWTVPTLYQVVLSGGGAQPILDSKGRPLSGFADEPMPLPGRGRDACLIATFTP